MSTSRIVGRVAAAQSATTHMYRAVSSPLFASPPAERHPASPRTESRFHPNTFYHPAEFARQKPRPPTTRPKYRPLGPSAPESRKKDVFRQLDIDPVKEYHNTQLLAHFTTTMGKIMPRNVTGLSWRSQRKIGKAIRRSKMLGLMPMFCKPITYRNVRVLGQ